MAEGGRKESRARYLFKFLPPWRPPPRACLLERVPAVNRRVGLSNFTAKERRWGGSEISLSSIWNVRWTVSFAPNPKLSPYFILQHFFQFCLKHIQIGLWTLGLASAVRKFILHTSIRTSPFWIQIQLPCQSFPEKQMVHSYSLNIPLLRNVLVVQSLHMKSHFKILQNQPVNTALSD